MEDTNLKIPYNKDQDITLSLLQKYYDARLTSQRSYPQFNSRSLYDAIDDWTLRFNGYISGGYILDEPGETDMYLNFTRNTVISYLSKVALQRPDVKITAVNKKSGLLDRKFADVLQDLNRYSLNEENGDARFLEAAFECVVKGTVVVYEGYRKETQKGKVPKKFNAETGKVATEKVDRIIFDNCFQKVVPLEDFFIANPYQPDVQKQPWLIWRELTTYDEAKRDFGHYSEWDSVKPGMYTLATDASTFYRMQMQSDLKSNQVEILRYYNRAENCHTVLVNGVVIYDDVMPFRDGMYPFAKTIYEPFDNYFFWGASLPNKIMGEQDLMNTFWSMMIDKTKGSLLPYGLSSDLDDIIEDDVLRTNKIRKVTDVNKWKFDTLPAVNSAEQMMLQTTMSFAKENSGDVEGGAAAATPKGGSVTARQALMKQREAQQKLSYSLFFLEDLERDRTLLRINHILQFYSIPKIEKITGKNGKEIEELIYRDVRLSNIKLSDGNEGNKVIKIIDDSYVATPDDKMKLQDDLSVLEEMGEATETPTEALAVSVDTFYDYNLAVEVVRNSSYERNQVLDQAVRMEYVNWRLSLAPIAPVDGMELVKYVDEAFDVDSSRFEPKQNLQQMQQPLQQPIGIPGQIGATPLQKLAPTNNGLDNIL